MRYWKLGEDENAKTFEVKKIVDYFVANGWVKKVAEVDAQRFEKYKTVLDLYLSEMDMLAKGVTGVDVDELDSNYPNVFKRLYSLDKKVIIRSSNNLSLIMDEMNK